MEWFMTFFLSFEFLLVVATIIMVLYLIFKRIEDKKLEDFDDRDN